MIRLTVAESNHITNILFLVDEVQGKSLSNSRITIEL